MYIPFRALLILLVFSVAAGPIQANHKVGVGHAKKPQLTKNKNRTDKELIQYNKQLLQAYDLYREKAAQVWGSDEAVVPSMSRDVTYRDNLKQRSIVDYEQGTVKVELAIKPQSAENSRVVIKKLANAIEKTILQGPDERTIIEIANNPTPPKTDKPPVLSNLVANHDGKPLTREEVETFMYLQSKMLDRRSVTGKDGKERIVVSTQFELVADHMRVRAEKYRESVNYNSQEHGIPAPLIYAIIETESSFNPTARSPVPAFGLMQLVPGRGARDAYRFLFLKDRIVKDTYLYIPDNNIELGVAYLRIIYFRYLKHITDPESRQWAAIAAYNAGVKNVIRSFVGRYTKANHSSRWSWRRQGLNQINKMESEQVYKHLRLYLPAEESRDYLKKVRERMAKYNT